MHSPHNLARCSVRGPHLTTAIFGMSAHICDAFKGLDMALIARGMYKLLLRVDVEQDISQKGWKFILSQVLPTPWNDRQLGTPSFDGEIVCIEAMSSMDMSAISRVLMSFGFRWSRDLGGADFAWFAVEYPKLEWLEVVQAQPLQAELPEVELWMLSGSQSQYFADHQGRVWWRGEDYDW